MVQLSEKIAESEWRKLLAEREAVAKRSHAQDHKLSKLGQHVASFSMREYMAAKIKYEKSFNDGNPISDQDFLRRFIRDNPHVRVKTTRGTRGNEITQAVGVPRGTIYRADGTKITP